LHPESQIGVGSTKVVMLGRWFIFNDMEHWKVSR